MGTPHIVGLDIGTSAVRAVELRFGADGPAGDRQPVLVHVAEETLPLGAVREGEVVEQSIVATAIKQLWSHGKFSTKNVAIGVGNQRVLVRDLEMPWMAESDRRTALPFHVADTLPMPLDDAILDLVVTETDTEPGPSGRMMRGMLVAAQRHTVETNVAAVEQAGLRPVLVDLNGFALIRSVARDDLAEAVVAIIDLGTSSSTVVVADHLLPRLVRNLPIGGQTITSTVASTLHLPHPDAERAKQQVGLMGDNLPVREAVQGPVRQLVESIRNTFVYYGSTHPGRGIDTAVVTGGGLALPGFGQYLASATRASVVVGDPLSRLRDDSHGASASFRHRSATLALAIGLAHGAAA